MATEVQTGASVFPTFKDKRSGRNPGTPELGGGALWYSSPQRLRARMAGITTVTADGVNTITVADPSLLYIGLFIDVFDDATIANTTPTTVISNRQITAIAGSVITYSGADAALGNGDVVCVTGDGPMISKYFDKVASMTVNDMIYALRLHTDSASI